VCSTLLESYSASALTRLGAARGASGSAAIPRARCGLRPIQYFLKPANVTEFPQRRIDFRGIGDLQGGRAQRALVAGKRAQRVGAAFEQRRAQLLAVAASDQRRIVDDRHAL